MINFDAIVATPQLLNLRDTKGRVPAGAVRIDRRTRWGNPYRIGVGNAPSRNDVIERYRAYLKDRIERGEIALEHLAELHGKTLACWCAPLPCHGEVLAAAAAWAHRTLNG